jgi:uncharacterized protein (TIGR02268 family)
VASVARAKEREPVETNIYLSDHPSSEAPNVYVAGRIATVLRFEQPCDPVRTKMLGWEGRFEPLLVGGRSVVLVPLHDIEPEDRFLLVVTLADGKELPFTVKGREGRGDQQVNVFADREGAKAVLASLYDALGRERVLKDENERHRKEENSVDHAFATLLANGSVKQTPFVQDQKWLLKDMDVEMVVRVYAGKAKAAVVFQITNRNHERPWSLMEARLATVSQGESRPFALRMNQAEIAPGGSGTLAVVADRSAFASEKGPVNLALELFRGDGLQQAFVLLDHRLARE